MNPRLKLPQYLIELNRKRDKLIPLKSVQVTEHARVRSFIDAPLGHEAEIREAYQQARNELQNLRARRLLCTPSVAAKERVTFFMACSMAYTYAAVLTTLLMRNFDCSERAMGDAQDLLDEILALTEDAAQFAPLGSYAMTSLLLVAWPMDPIRRAEIEMWVSKLQGNIPIVG